MTGKRHVHVLDATLRDGSHPMGHAFTAEQIAAVAAGLDGAGLEYIEVSHGDGLGGSSINYGRVAPHRRGDARGGLAGGPAGQARPRSCCRASGPGRTWRWPRGTVSAPCGLLPT